MTNAQRILVALALCAGLLSWWWVGTGSIAVAEPSADSVADPRAEDLVVEGPDVESAARRDRSEDRVALEQERRPPAQFLLRGRCVDATGTPLAGCRVRLRGFGTGDEDVAEYERLHGTLEWVDPPILETESDGSFEFRFWPPPPYQFILHITAAESVPMTGRWSSLEAGGTKDLGDVLMMGGVRVRGSVRDTAGVPQSGVSVSLRESQWPSRFTGEIPPRASRSTRTADGGEFEFDDAMPPGGWRVDVPGRQLVSELDVTVPEGLLETVLELLVMPESDITTIEGTVVDETGQPVPRAGVGVGRPWFFPNTDTEGRFRLERTPQSILGPLRLGVRKEGFEDLLTDSEFDWGDRDVVLTVRRALSLRIEVVEAESGVPVEDYGIRLFPLGGNGAEIRERGPHEGGVTVVESVQRGTQVLVIEPAVPDFMRSPPLQFQVTDAGAPDQRVELRRLAGRTVRVVYPDETPAVGSDVALVWTRNDRPIQPRSFVADLRPDMGHLMSQEETVGLRWASGETDDRGECELFVHPGMAFALSVRGRDHLPFLRNGFVLGDGSEPVTVVVEAGGTLRGQITPPEFVSQLWLGAIRNRMGVEPSNPAWIDLVPADGSGPAHYDNGEPKVIGQDGSFVIPRVPAGLWRVAINPMAGWGPRRIDTGVDVEVVSGEAKQVSLALDHLLFTELEAEILLDGVVLQDRWLLVDGTGVDDRGEAWDRRSRVWIDEAGSFTAFLPRGDYRFSTERLTRPVGTLTVPEPFRVSGATGIRRAFHIRSAPVRLQVLGPDGEPREGVTLLLQGQGVGQSLQQSDHEGRLTSRLTVGAYTVRVLPKVFAAKYRWSSSFHQFEPERQIFVGTFEVREGAAEIIVRLSEQAGY